MKKITVIIPTHKRVDSLIRTLNSIPNSPFVNTVVMFDDDKEGFDYVSSLHFPNVKTFLSDTNIGSVACRNKMAENVKDGLIFLCDDMEFPKEFSVCELIQDFNKSFPDDDGVFGFKQNLPNFDVTGVALLGRSFLNRYPQKHFLYHGYWLFASSEVGRLASKYDKLKLYNLTIIHHHPAQGRSTKDSTHYLGRKYSERDRQIKRERTEKGELWGDKCGSVLSDCYSVGTEI